MRITLHTPSSPQDPHRFCDGGASARGVEQYLRGQGHEIIPIHAPSSAGVWRRPALWAETLRAARLAEGQVKDCDVWLTHQTDSSTPDIIGPWATRRAGLPYFLLTESRTTKRFRPWTSLPSAILNLRSHKAADHHFVHGSIDGTNRLAVVPQGRTTLFRPGIQPERFRFNKLARQTLRLQWNASQGLVVISAATFSPGAKLEGLKLVLRAGAALLTEIPGLQLILAGDGPGRQELEQLGRALLPGRVRFLGHVPQEELPRVFSAGDIFAFPGISESQGLIYLKAQACGLPAVAWDQAAAPEVITHGQSGLITPAWDEQAFTAAIRTLLTDHELRRRMGANAVRLVSERHDIRANFTLLETVISKAVAQRNGQRT